MMKRNLQSLAPDIVSTYRRLAPDYERRWARYIRKTHTLVHDWVPLSDKQSVLDVACGTGLMLSECRSRASGIEVTGVDICDAMLERARARMTHDDLTH